MSADYELAPGERPVTEEDVKAFSEAKPTALIPAPVGMVTKDITCSVRRVIQPKQYESWEVSMSVTVTPDPALTTGANLEKIHGLISSKIDWAAATWTERHSHG